MNCGPLEGISKLVSGSYVSAKHTVQTLDPDFPDFPAFWLWLSLSSDGGSWIYWQPILEGSGCRELEVLLFSASIYFEFGSLLANCCNTFGYPKDMKGNSVLSFGHRVKTIPPVFLPIRGSLHRNPSKTCCSSTQPPLGTAFEAAFGDQIPEVEISLSSSWSLGGSSDFFSVMDWIGHICDVIRVTFFSLFNPWKTFRRDLRKSRWFKGYNSKLSICSYLNEVIFVR